MLPGHSKEFYPLTSLQKSMVLSSLRAPRSGVYVLQQICELNEELDFALLKRAWNLVQQRHPALRTSIGTGSGEAFGQRVHERPSISWQEIDWTAVAEEARREKLEAFLRGDSERGFRFEEGVPLRITLLRTAEHSCLLIWTIHHALADGRSCVIVWQEWLALYDGLRRGEEGPLADPVPFREHVDWLRRQDMGNAERYWRDTLAGLSQTTDYVVDRIRSASSRRSSGFAKEGVRLSEELTRELSIFALRHGVTVNNLVQGAWALLLSRYSGRRDIVFGVTRAGRRTSPAGAGATVGLVVNTLPFRVSVVPETPLTPWLKQIRRQWVSMREHEHTPLEKVWEWSGLPNGMPPFDVVLAYDHEPVEESLRKLGGNWQRRRISRVQWTDSPLTLAAYGGPAASLEISYDTRLFGSGTTSAMARHLATLLQNFVAQPECPLGALKMLPEQEEKWLLEDRNQTDVPFPKELCAHQLIEQQARRVPGNIALAHSGGSISYSEMNQRANRLARVLREKGAGPEDLVAVCMRRSPEAVIAILAVAKAGAAFVGLDPSLPPTRLSQMAEDAGVKFVLGDDSGLPNPGTYGCEVLSLYRLQSEAARLPADDLSSRATPESAAYAVYTSGSTGKPKAVVVTHRALVNHTLAALQAFGISETDRRLQFASLGTDVFVAEVFNYLCSGATLVLCLDRQGGSVREFLRLLDEHRITITGLPSMWWNEWVAAMSEGTSTLPPSLRAVIVGMERVNPAAFRTWQRVAGDRIRWFNAYGPTETTPTAAVYEAGSSEWEGESFVPIGKPIANTRMYVLDGSGNPVPVGIAGELYIGGAGVARGYSHAPDQTASRFLQDPFGRDPQGRMYRTGDLVFSLPDGNLVFLGRTDNQVKIRGFRVELEEIEAVVAQHPAVCQCAVIAVGEEGREKLVAYFMPHAGQPPDPRQLRLHLSRHLPDHMVPESFVALPEMPRASSGKIDRQSLLLYAPQQLDAARGCQEPSTPTEHRLAALWQEVLDIPRVGTTDNFFDLGGNSLQATRLITRIHTEFGKELPMASVLRAPTIARMAWVLDSDGGAPAGAAAHGNLVVSLQPRGSEPPLFCVSSTADDPQCFRHLPKHLGNDQPVYVLCNPVQEGGRVLTIEEMADRVGRAIVGLRPGGPYLLSGYCLGGVVAFEAARRLISRGEEVRLIALLDTPAPGYPKLLRSRSRYWRQLHKLLPGARDTANGIGFREIAGHLQVVGRLVQRKALAQIRRNFIRAGMNSRALPSADSTGANGVPAALYVPKPVAAPIAQFIARDDAIRTQVLEDPRLGWRDLCEREFEVYRVGGTHESMLLEPHAVELAAALAEALRKANCKSAAGRAVSAAVAP